MSRYRTVSVRMWADERFRRLSPLQPSGQALWLYLLTCPLTTNIPGLFSAGEAALAENLDWPLETFREAFREVFREGLIEVDWKARVIWIHNALKYNPPASPNVVRSWRTTLDEIPECALKAKAIEELKGFTEALGQGFAKAFAEASAKALPNQDQEQDQDKDIHTTRSARRAEKPPGPNREFRNWVVATWGLHHGCHQPTWSTGAWVRLAALHAQHGEEAIRQRWPVYLQETADFYRGHPLAKFCRDFDRWAPLVTATHAPTNRVESAKQRVCNLEAMAIQIGYEPPDLAAAREELTALERAAGGETRD